MGKLLASQAQLDGVDPKLLEIVQHAVAALPYDARITPHGGMRPKGGKSDLGNHSNGYAIDVQLYDGDKALPNEGTAAYAAYEQYAQAARVYQLQKYPDLPLRTGLGFATVTGGSTLDPMHLDIRPGGTMPLYDWDKGGKGNYSKLSNGGLGGANGARLVSSYKQSLAGSGNLLPPENIPGDTAMGTQLDVQDVKGIQQNLTAAGFSPGKIDGVSGLKTKAAIRAFQQANGLAVDGIVGPQTQEKLAAASNKATMPSSAAPPSNALAGEQTAAAAAPKANELGAAPPAATVSPGPRRNPVRTGSNNDMPTPPAFSLEPGFEQRMKNGHVSALELKAIQDYNTKLAAWEPTPGKAPYPVGPETSRGQLAKQGRDYQPSLAPVAQPPVVPLPSLPDSGYVPTPGQGSNVPLQRGVSPGRVDLPSDSFFYPAGQSPDIWAAGKSYLQSAGVLPKNTAQLHEGVPSPVDPARNPASGHGYSATGVDGATGVALGAPQAGYNPTTAAGASGVPYLGPSGQAPNGFVSAPPGTAPLPSPVVAPTPMPSPKGIAPVPPTPFPSRPADGNVAAPVEKQHLVRLPSGKMIAVGTVASPDGVHSVDITDDGHGNAVLKQVPIPGAIPGVIPNPLTENPNTMAGHQIKLILDQAKADLAAKAAGVPTAAKDAVTATENLGQKALGNIPLVKGLSYVAAGAGNAFNSLFGGNSSHTVDAPPSGDYFLGPGMSAPKAHSPDSSVSKVNSLVPSSGSASYGSSPVVSPIDNDNGLAASVRPPGAASSYNSLMSHVAPVNPWAPMAAAGPMKLSPKVAPAEAPTSAPARAPVAPPVQMTKLASDKVVPVGTTFGGSSQGGAYQFKVMPDGSVTNLKTGKTSAPAPSTNNQTRAQKAQSDLRDSGMLNSFGMIR